MRITAKNMKLTNQTAAIEGMVIIQLKVEPKAVKKKNDAVIGRCNKENKILVKNRRDMAVSPAKGSLNFDSILCFVTAYSCSPINDVFKQSCPLNFRRSSGGSCRKSDQMTLGPNGQSHATCGRKHPAVRNTRRSIPDGAQKPANFEYMTTNLQKQLQSPKDIFVIFLGDQRR